MGVPERVPVGQRSNKGANGAMTHIPEGARKGQNGQVSLNVNAS